MRFRTIMAYSCVALVAGATSLFGQPVQMPPAAAPIVVGDCPPAGPVCPPKPCSICGLKSFCQHTKCAPPTTCAPAAPVHAPAPRITVVVPPPEVVFRTASQPVAAPAPAAGHSCFLHKCFGHKHKAAVGMGAPAAVPVGALGATPVLVPQVSYSMQPVVQQVVTMQAVPTVSYGVALGVSQGVGVGVNTGIGFGAVNAVGLGAVGAQGVGAMSEAELLLLRQLLAAKTAGAQGVGTAAPGAGAATGIGAAAGPTVAELDAAIKQLSADVFAAFKIQDARIKAVEDNTNKVIGVLQNSANTVNTAFPKK